MHTEEAAVRCKYKSVNNNEKPFECTNCGITFLDSLRQICTKNTHENTHRGEKISLKLMY